MSPNARFHLTPPPVRPGFPRTAYGRLPRLATGSSLSITGLSRQPLDQALQRSLALRVQSRTLDPDLGRDHRRTVRTCAATNPGSGAARKATALAISSRRPVRPLVGSFPALAVAPAAPQDRRRAGILWNYLAPAVSSQRINSARHRRRSVCTASVTGRRR